MWLQILHFLYGLINYQMNCLFFISYYSSFIRYWTVFECSFRRCWTSWMLQQCWINICLRFSISYSVKKKAFPSQLTCTTICILLINFLTRPYATFIIYIYWCLDGQLVVTIYDALADNKGNRIYDTMIFIKLPTGDLCRW